MPWIYPSSNPAYIIWPKQAYKYKVIALKSECSNLINYSWSLPLLQHDASFFQMHLLRYFDQNLLTNAQVIVPQPIDQSIQYWNFISKQRTSLNMYGLCPSLNLSWVSLKCTSWANLIQIGHEQDICVETVWDGQNLFL